MIILIAGFCVLFSLMLYINFTGHVDAATWIIDLSQFLIVGLVIAFSRYSFRKRAGIKKVASISTDMEKASELIISDARRNSDYLWKTYAPQSSFNLFRDQDLSALYNSFFEKVRVQMGRGADVDCDIRDYMNSEKIDLYMNQSVLGTFPGVMTALGILGTFIGLTIGLQHFNIDSSNLTQSIQPLINGLKVAFHTSIYGITFSLLYNWVYKTTLETAYRKLDVFLEQFNRYVLPFEKKESAEQTGKIIAKELSREVATLLEQTQNMMAEYSEAITEKQTEGIAEIGNALIDRINKVTSSKLKEFSRALGDANIRLNDSLNRLDSVIQETEKLQAEVKAASDAVAGVLRQNGQNSAEMQVLVANLEAETKNIGHFCSTVQSYLHEISGYQTAMDGAANRIEKTIENLSSFAVSSQHEQALISSELAETSEMTEQLLSSVRRSLSTWDQDIQRDFTGKIDTALEHYESTIFGTLDSLHRALERSNQYADQVNKSVQDIPVLIDDSLRQAQQQMDDTVSRTEKSIEGVSVLTRSFQQNQQTISAELAATARATNELLTSVQSSLSSWDQTIWKGFENRSNSVLERFERTVSGTLDVLQRAIESINAYISEANKAIKYSSAVPNDSAQQTTEW